MFQRLSLSDGLMLSCVQRRKNWLICFILQNFLSLNNSALSHNHLNLSLFSLYSVWTLFFCVLKHQKVLWLHIKFFFYSVIFQRFFFFTELVKKIPKKKYFCLSKKKRSMIFKRWQSYYLPFCRKNYWLEPIYDYL